MDKGKAKWRKLAITRTDLPSIYELTDNPLVAGLWCLLISKQELGSDYLSFDQQENILCDFLDIPIKAIQIKRAFARAGKRIIKSKKDNNFNKISQPGEIYLYSSKKDQPINVLYINPDKPRSAKKNLESLVKSIPKGVLSISDPYYGLKTLEVLESFIKYHKKIKFLTSKVGGGEKLNKLKNAIKDFKKEFKGKIEIRLTSSSELHDRYVIAEKIFFIMGHGIKNLGEKESLVVAIEDRYGKDIRETLKKAFEKRWSSSRVL